MELLLLLAFFVWGALTWFWPRWMIIILSGLFPLYLLRFSFAGVPFTFVEWLIYASTFAGLCRWLFFKEDVAFWQSVKRFFVHEESFFERLKCFTKSIYFPLVLLFIVSIFSTVFVPETVTLIDGKTVIASRRIALGVLKGFIFVPMLYFVLVTQFLTSCSGLKKALYAYGLSALGLSFWALFQVVSGTYITPDFRASGPFESANYLAIFIAPAFLFFLGSLWYRFIQPDVKGILFWRKVDLKKWYIFFEVLAALVIFSALYYSRSFGAFLGISIALFWFLIFQWKVISRKAFAIFLGVLALLSILFLTQVSTEKFQQIFAGRSSFQVRKEVWTVSFGLIKAHPFRGIGLGQFESQYQLNAPTVLKRAPVEWVMLHPHNLYLMFWLSTGIFGLILFFWILAHSFAKLKPIFKNFLPRDNKGYHYRYLLVLSSTLLVYLLVHGFLDVPFWKNDLALQFWLIVGAMYVKR